MIIHKGSGPILEPDPSDFLFRNPATVLLEEKDGVRYQIGVREYVNPIPLENRYNPPKAQAGDSPVQLNSINYDDIQNYQMNKSEKEQLLELAKRCGGLFELQDVFGFKWINVAFTGGCVMFSTKEKWKDLPYTDYSTDEYYKIKFTKAELSQDKI